MRVVFIHPNYHSDGAEIAGNWPPAWVAYLGGAVKSAGFKDIHFLHAMTNDMTEDRLRDELRPHGSLAAPQSHPETGKKPVATSAARDLGSPAYPRHLCSCLELLRRKRAFLGRGSGLASTGRSACNPERPFGNTRLPGIAPFSNVSSAH